MTDEAWHKICGVEERSGGGKWVSEGKGEGFSEVARVTKVVAIGEGLEEAGVEGSGRRAGE